MNATTYSGSNSAQSITNGAAGASFQPDFAWIKSRNTGDFHNLVDSVRGTNKNLSSDSTAAETTVARLTSFDSNGVTLAGGYGATNASGQTFVNWQWKAGGTAVTNTSGSVSAQVSANTTSGFSVVTFNAGTAGNQSFGHGLGVAPSMVIMKDRVTVGYGNWSVFFSGITSSNQTLYLNGTDAVSTLSNIWGSAVPTSTVVNFGSNVNVKANDNCVAYCWSQIAGYSAFGSYTANGSADGPFVYTGFRPRFVMTKKSSGTGAWAIVDTSIIPYNQETTYLQPNTSGAVVGGTSSNGMDINSNGFKIRSSDASFNETNGDTYIYACFAENPLKFANAR
jgi:hypothetical protein